MKENGGCLMANYHSLSTELQKRIIKDREEHFVNPFAFCNNDVLRRDNEHDKANLWRPAFVRDIEKIMNIPYYNRYSDKTQVFSLYKNDDISRRAQHVQLVSRIARNIGSMLGLNLDLIEAISLGHDIGHTPFGHAGERMLDRLYYNETRRHFNHNIHSARVLDYIFPLNLSMQTLDGIICHNGEIELSEYKPSSYSDFHTFDQKVEACYLDAEENKRLIPATLEACVVRISDIIAYVGKDRQDAQKLGLVDANTIYSNGIIGTSNAEIINNMIVNIVENSYGKNYLKLDEAYFQAISVGKSENYNLIYNNEKISHVYEEQINPMIEQVYHRLLQDLKNHNKESMIYKHHINYILEVTGYYSRRDYTVTEANDIVVDYIASMTDDYFIDLYNILFPEGTYEVKYNGYFE